MKSVHGPPLKVSIGSKKKSKTLINHDTLFRIKSEINLSGNKVTKIAKILKDDTDVKIEPYFKEAVVDKNQSVHEFFDVQEIDMLVPLPNQDCYTKVKKE